MPETKYKKKVLGVMSLMGIMATLYPGHAVYANPSETPSTLEEYWEREGVEAGSTVTMDMLQEVERELLRISDDISNKEVERKKLEDKIKEKKTEINETEIEIKDREERYEMRLERAQNQLRSMQQSSINPGMKAISIIMGSDSFIDAIGRMKAMFDITEANTNIMSGLSEEREALELLKQKLVDENETLVKQENELINLLDELEEEKERATSLHESFSDQWDQQEARRRELQASQEELLNNYRNRASYDRNTLDRIINQELDSQDLSDKDVQALINSPVNPVISNHVVSNALDYLGTPYVWGGSTTSGFDCSGLTQFVYRNAGISIPRTAAQQSTQGKRVSMNALEPGDMLFFGPEGSSYHVGIYLGEGNFIHAPKPGDFVKITKLSSFTPDFAKRVIPDNDLNAEKINQLAKRTKERTTPSHSSTKSKTFNVTYYSAYDGAQIGITAGGTNMANGNIHTRDGYRIVAVDTRVIPMGTKMEITTGNGETFIGKADDTGGAIKGNKIDIAVASRSEALRLGRTTATVKILD